VYAQVTRLFETATDLLEDFKQFLPESAASNQNKGPLRPGGEDAFPLSSTRSDPAYLAAASANSHLHQTPRPEQHRLPPMGNFAPTPSASRDNKRKRGDRQGPTSMTPIAPESNNVGGRGALNQQTNGNKVRVSQLFFTPPHILIPFYEKSPCFKCPDLCIVIVSRFTIGCRKRHGPPYCSPLHKSPSFGNHFTPNFLRYATQNTTQICFP
jgi:hypothetical protein